MWTVYALLASLFWGMSYVVTEQIYGKLSVLSGLAIMSTIVAVACIAVGVFTGTLKSDLITLSSSRHLMLVVAAGGIILLAAEYFIGSSIVSRDATLAGLIEISYPLFIALFAYMLYGRSVTLATIVGGILIFAGVFVIYSFNK